MLSAEQVQFFRDNGYLKVPGALSSAEVKELRDATARLIESGPTPGMTPGERKDYQYGRVKGADKVLRRIENVIGKGEAFLRLLGHPVLLDAAAKIVGEQFVPTYDSCVIKMPGRGVEVPWHRDGGGPRMFFDDPQTGRRFPAVNFDFYLDESTEKTGALWVVPGSNKEVENRAPQLARAGQYAGVPGAMMVPMQPGDMLLHDVTLYHGSPETEDAPSIRRVIYYEFRDKRFIDAHHRVTAERPNPGNVPWTDDWIAARLALLQKALDTRRAAGLPVPFAQHPIEALRAAAREQTRVPQPGWDESA